jgi:aryl-alcohol dehydrogenase-like predicted oxidoreductase
MEFRQFGRTGLKVSAVGFGCWEIGGTYGRIDESQFQRAVAQAIDSGINCFDTAEAYGMGVSEEALARALGGRRNNVVIATKFGVGYEEMPNRRDSSRERILASIDKSLQRLRTDHVDLYLAHWPDPNTPLHETMRALDDVVRQGKVRFIGVSNFRLAQIEECARRRRIDVVQYAWKHVRPPHAGRDLPLLRGAADRGHGLRLAGLRYAERYVPRRHVVRRERLALARRQSGQPEPVPNPVRQRAFST